jgi:hypothetical protein
MFSAVWAKTPFKHFEGQPIKVVGWPERDDETERWRWIETFSDHALLFGQIES